MTRTGVVAAALLVLIVATGVAVRVAGLQFGLPAVYNPDEVAIMSRALGFAKGTLNPHNFLYPTFYFYVLFAWVGGYLGWLLVTGRAASVAALEQSFFTDPTGIYTAGRALGVAAGTATLLVLYRLGVRLADRRTGLAAAAFLAVAPLHVRDSHYVKHDVPATLAVAVAYLAMASLWRPARERRRHAVPVGGAKAALVAGAACGVAFSTHYYCVFLAIPLAWTIWHRWRSQGLSEVARRLCWAGLAAALVFLLLSPFLLVEPGTAWRDITANRAIVVDRAIAEGTFAPARRYAAMLWRDTLGTPVVVAAAAGIVWMLRTDPARAALLLAFPVPFLLFIANTAPASRYLNPVLPFMALFAGWAVARSAQWLRLPGPVLAAIVTVMALPGLWTSVATDRFFRQDDTRTLALRWIEEHIPAGATVMIQPYSVPLTASRESLTEALQIHLGSAEAASTKYQIQLGLNPYPAPAYRLVYLGSGGLDVDKIYLSYDDIAQAGDLTALRRLGVAFVVFKRYNRPDPEASSFLAALARGGRRIAAFSPYRPDVSMDEQARVDPFLHNTDTRIDAALERPGPPLEIWQLDGAE